MLIHDETNTGAPPVTYLLFFQFNSEEVDTANHANQTRDLGRFQLFNIDYKLA